MEELSPPPKKTKGPVKKASMYSKDQTSDDKFNRTGSAESGNPKNRGKGKGISSDDKFSRDSNSQGDSERGPHGGNKNRRIIQ